MSSRNLSIKGKKNERVAISNCNLEPLNLLIPGGAPILVPKHKAWPGRRKKETTKVRIPLIDEDFYDAEEEDEMEERLAAEVKSRKASQTYKNSFKSEKKGKGKDLHTKDAKKSSKIDIEALRQHIKEQEAYTAKLKAKFVGKMKKKTEAEAEAHHNNGDETESNTDTSEKTRDHVLKVPKIKAAGTNDHGFTPSEDAQILARKEAGESFRTIAGFMKRTKKQVSQRYWELVNDGKTVDTVGGTGGDGGEGAATTDVVTDAATTAGETATTDAVTTDAEKTDAEEEGGAQMAGYDFGGLFDMTGVVSKLEALAAEQEADMEKEKAREEEVEEEENKRKKEEGDTASKKSKNKLYSSPNQGGESGYEAGEEVMPEDIPEDIGTLLYINQYARDLLRDKDQVPEADDRFDDEDCVLLALSQRQHQEGRWEEIQARFATLTGRMVPIEVLKYKLGEGEKPEGY